MISKLASGTCCDSYLSISANIPLGHWHPQNRKDDHEVPRILFALKVRYEFGHEIGIGIV
jgi:hypothetical protein